MKRRDYMMRGWFRQRTVQCPTCKGLRYVNTGEMSTWGPKKKLCGECRGSGTVKKRRKK
jgi:DnaJ-class molecular chaperone